jgi:predicted GTPase
MYIKIKEYEMSKKILTRFNIKPELLEVIQTEADNQNISKHDFLNSLLYDKLIKKDNRLSQHIARDVENLILVLLTNEQKFPTIKEAIEAGIIADKIKRNVLMERREAKKERFTTFWRRILNELNPEQFVQIRTKEAALEKLKRLFQIAFENKEVFA